MVQPRVLNRDHTDCSDVPIVLDVPETKFRGTAD